MKILVRAPNWVGDAVMAIPALEAIRRTHAGDEICVLARPVVADLFSDSRLRTESWSMTFAEATGDGLDVKSS